MKKNAAVGAPTRSPKKTRIKEAPTRLGREYANPEIQFPAERDATSRNRYGTPRSFFAGQRRGTRRKLTITTPRSGAVYAAKRPAAPAAKTAKTSPILTAP